MKYEPCHAIIVHMSPVFSYVSNIFFNGLSCTITFYRAAVSDHCVTLVTAFLQRVRPADKEKKMNLSRCKLQMRENVYKGVPSLLPDALIRFAVEASVENIVARTRDSLGITHTAVLRSSEIDWNQFDCAGWHSYEYPTDDMREVLPTPCGSHIHPELNIELVKVLKWSIRSTFKRCLMKSRSCSMRGLESFEQLQLEMVPRLLLQVVSFE